MSYWKKQDEKNPSEPIPFGIRLKSLELDAFRLFNKLVIDFDDELTVFIGDNGSGKTTILDATAELLKCLVEKLIYIPYLQ